MKDHKIECNKWFGQKYLDKGFLMKWSPDNVNKELKIKIEVFTKGWISFGFSKHGKMNEVDMVIGWVDYKGQMYLKDYWINESFVLSEDRSQDWYLLSASENSTHTVLEFNRKYVTCDDINDLQIYDNEYEISNIVFGYSFEDPTDGTQTIFEASKRGLFHQNLFIPEIPFKPKENDIEIIDFFLNLTLPRKKFTSYCKIVKLNNNYEKHKIIKIIPVIPDYIEDHHFALQNCTKNLLDTNYELSFKDKQFDCYDTRDPLVYGRKLCSQVVFQTSQSNDPIDFPELTGIPLNGISYYLVEGHLINRLEKEIEVSPSIRVWTTKEKHKYDSAWYGFQLSPGIAGYNWAIIVPPKQVSFKISGVFSSYCLNIDDTLNELGIFIFHIIFHSHSAISMEIRHFRDEQMLRVIHLYQYDSGYQSFIKIKSPVNFRQMTDKIVITCEYNTINDTKSYTALVEHCAVAFYYYPKIYEIVDSPTTISTNLYSTILTITGLEQIDNFDGLINETIIRKPVEHNNTKLIDFITDNIYRIKNPKELERTQLLADMKECCDIFPVLNEKRNKPCKVISKPHGLYKALMGMDRPNSCRVKKFSGAMKLNNQIHSSDIKLSFKLLINSFKISFEAILL